MTVLPVTLLDVGNAVTVLPVTLLDVGNAVTVLPATILVTDMRPRPRGLCTYCDGVKTV